MPNSTRLAAVLLLSFATTAALADNVRGAWIAPQPWPLIAAHAVLTPDGRVLTYGTDGTGKQTGLFIYDVWDPNAGGAGVGHLTLPNVTNTDLFCSSQLIMPQNGNIFIGGGDNFVNGATTNTGNNNSNVYNSSDTTIARGNNMNRARWYSTATTLVNGEIYIQGGNGGAPVPEIRGANGVFRLLSAANTSTFAPLYPRNWLAPDSRVFGFDNTGKMYYVSPTGTGMVTMAGQIPGATNWTASAVMFQPGRILQMGGASSAAVVIDINGPQPVVTSTQAMSTQRQWVSATVLPDGRVLGTGGSSVENQLTGVNNVAEIWNPATGQWTQGTPGVNARLYHSGALLLPDASVIILGGGAPGPLVNLNAEIYYPPYLYSGPGVFAPRPSIVTAPDTIDVGQNFTVDVASGADVSRVTLVKTGSTTHSNNMDQRFIELPYSASGATLDVQLPTNPSVLPPGYYMLFVLDENGVPSRAKMVKVNIAVSQELPSDVTAAIGGGGGNPFQLACEAGEVLAGVRGSSGTFVQQVGPLCVTVNPSGQWIGSPTARGLTGTTAGSATYTRTCPVNSAISGFRGRSSLYVDQLDFECRALTSTGKLTGTGTFLGAVGNETGTAVGPYRCDSENPGFALYGRSGSRVDNVGLQCRQATATVINNPPSLTNPGSQASTIDANVDVPITASDPDAQTLTFSATGLPPGLSVNGGTGRITGVPTMLGDYAVALTVSDTIASATVNFAWSITQRPPFSLNPLPGSAPRAVGAPVTYTASSANGVDVQYKWFFDDGTPSTAYSTSPTISHTFTTPGVYYVTVSALSEGTPEQAQTVTQTIHLPLTANKPTASSNIAYENRAGGARVWVVNQDNDSVTAFNAANNAKLAEINVGTGPRSIAVAPNGRLWVTNKLAGTISIIDQTSLAVVQTLTLPFASQPFGLAFAPTGGVGFVALEATGRVLKLDAATGAVLGTVNVGPNPRHVSVNADGLLVYASRFVTPPLPGESTAQVQPGTSGGEVVVIASGSMIVNGTITLGYSDKPDFEIQGSGVPNYLGALAISPDGASGWVPSKQDNILRGTLRNGSNLNFQNTVRAISSKVDLALGAEDPDARVDVDNSSLASAAAFDPYGTYLFVALETSREVAVLDAHGHWEIFRFTVGRAPQGLAVSPDGRRLYVNNFMDRSVGVYDLSRLIDLGESNIPAVATVSAVATEKLSAQVLRGKQFFYDARDTRLARDAYMSCASCHNDGGHDGRTWDLTGMGEGLRNTIGLRGRSAAQGFLHWSANFNEVQDFEAQIRGLAGGTGLMSDTAFNTGTRSQPLGDPKAGLSADLDALAAYVASLSSFANSPHRNADGTLTSAAVAGREVFRNANCAQCHSGTAFTGSAAANLQNIGTITQPTSGNRLGGVLTGIDTQTLRDVWSSAPYLHDGSAPTIAAAIAAHSGVSISGTDLTNLVSYVQQIGGQESSAPVQNRAPTVTNPGAQSGRTGVAVSLQISASDPDGTALLYSATSLPAGLGINASSGLVSGTPTTAGTRSVTVTVSDGTLTDSETFNWTLTTPDTTVPSKPGSFAAATQNGRPYLTWTASTDNVGVVGYIIYRATSSTQGPEVARVSAGARNWTDTSFVEGTRYYYSARAYDAAGNLSARTSILSVTPNQAPSQPGTLSATLVGGDPRLSWGASTDNVAVTGYVIYRSTNGGAGSERARTSSLTWTDTSASAGVRYTYNIRAYDARNNLSTRSNYVTIRAQ
jgi:YVTN family beta-propeller protein